MDNKNLSELNKMIKEKQEKIKAMEESEKNTGIKSYLLEDLKKEVARDLRRRAQLEAEKSNQNKLKNRKPGRDKANQNYDEFVKNFVKKESENKEQVQGNKNQGVQVQLNQEAINQKIISYDASLKEKDEKISSLEKEINGKQAYLQNIDKNNVDEINRIEDELDSAYDQIDEIKKEKNKIEKNKRLLNQNKEGYTKYKPQIDKLRKIEERFNSELKEQQKIKNSTQKEVNKLKKELEKVNKALENGSDLDNNLYNQLLINKENTEKTLNKKKAELKRANSRILSLQSKINKTSIAWKTLFENKDWDEINLRVVRQQRFTRETPEDDVKLTQKGSDREQNRAEDVSAIEPQGEEKSLRKYRKFSFRNIWNRFVNFVKGGHSGRSADAQEKQNQEKPEVDQFVEGLRRNVDQEYRKEVNRAIQEKYDQAHQKVEHKQKDDEQER